jgi:hypothetical protein
MSATAKTWRCPSCNLTVVALAVETGHRCPARKLRFVAFKRVEEAEPKEND